MPRRKTPEELKAEALERAKAFKRLFNTPDGKIVLENLEETFPIGRIFVPGDSHGTHVRVGHVEVIQYIKDVVEAVQDELA